MKKIIAVSFLIVFTMACESFFQPVPLPDKFCDEAGDRAESWLLATSEKLIKDGSMTREDMLSTIYYSMIRVTAIAQLAADDRVFVETWWRKVGEFYLEHAPDLTWDELIDYMFSAEEWGDRVQLIKIIVTPNAMAFKSLASIKPWDDCAMRAGHRYVGQIFGWQPL
jgi:hypothetical protein